MIFPLPEKFDGNELFIIFSTIITWALMFMLPRRLSAVTVTIIWTFNVFLALLADITLTVKPYELYFTIDHKTHELFDVVLHFVTYPTLPYFVVNSYQHYKPKGLKFLSFVVFWGGVAIALEWTSVQFDVFTYTGWKVYLSFFVYLIVFAVTIWLANFVEKKYPSNWNSKVLNMKKGSASQ
jgi:VanZ family protein